MFKLDKNMNVDEKKDLEELTDEEYIKYDLIKGLFRMNLIARLFYLLNAYNPSFTANSILKNIFSILYRCVRHSAQITHELLQKYSTFIDLIATKFLPEFIDPTTASTSADQVANTEMTLKLFRLMASSGVHSATRIFEKYNLKVCLLNYLAFSQNPATLSLHTEAVRLLKTLNCLIPARVTGLVDFETMLKNATSSLQLLSRTSSEADQNALYLQSVISLFNGLIGASTEDTTLIDMSSGFFSIIQTFLLNKFKFYMSSVSCGDLTSDFNLISVCFNFMVDYLENKYLDSDRRLEKIDYLITELYKPLLENKSFKLRFDDLIMSKLASRSTSTTDEALLSSFSRIKGNNLSYLPTMLNFGDADGRIKANLMKSIAPFGFMTGFVRLYLTCFKFRIKSFEASGYASSHAFLSNEYLQSYLRAYARSVSQRAESLSNCFLIMKYENYFVYYLLKLAFYLFNFEVRKIIFCFILSFSLI